MTVVFGINNLAMRKQKLQKLEQAIDRLNDAKRLIRDALKDTDSADVSISQIDEAIQDLKADILELS